jgi:hypothetical protein
MVIARESVERQMTEAIYHIFMERRDCFAKKQLAMTRN